MKLVWFPAWLCQNYTLGESFGRKCPYCPYSLSKQSNRLIYNNVETSSDERAEASDLIAFFSENYTAMEGFIEVSGGEALMRRDLAFILASVNHAWAMTSNTLLDDAIDSLIHTRALARCTSWSASWHPCSGQEARYARNATLLAQCGVNIRATVVVAKQTIDKLKETLDFLKSIPLCGINWHLDAHGDTEAVPELKRRADEILGEGVAYLAGPPPRGKMCNRHEMLMAVGADGTLYQCVTFAYQNKYPICKVKSGVSLRSLPRRVEWCDEECFACCDHIKHVG